MTRENIQNTKKVTSSNFVANYGIGKTTMNEMIGYVGQLSAVNSFDHPATTHQRQRRDGSNNLNGNHYP